VLICPCRVILAQLEGSGRGALGSYNSDQFQLLRDLLEAVPFKDGDEWLEHLLKQDRMLGEQGSNIQPWAPC
jgi:hypothetical protein